MRVLRNLALVIVLAMILLSVIIYWGSHDESVSGWVVNRSLTTASKEHQLDEFHGSLAKGITISQLSMTLKNEDGIVVKNLSTQWRFSFLKRTFEIYNAHVGQITFTQSNTSSEKANATDKAYEFSSPVKVIANKVHIDELIIKSEEQSRSIQAIKTAFELESADLTIQEFSLSSETTKFQTAGALKTQSPFNVDIKATVSDPVHYINAELEIAGSITSYTIDGNLQSLTGLLPAGSAELHASSNMKTVLLEDFRIESEAGNAVISGDLDWTDLLSANVTIHAKQVDPSWFNQEIDALVDLSGNIKVVGDKHDIDLEVSGAFNEEPIALAIHADGDLKQSTLSDSQLTIKANDVFFDGILNWENKTTAILNVFAKDLNPKSFNTNIDGSLDLGGVIELNGEKYSSNITLDGSLNDQPVVIALSLNGEKEAVTITNATLTSEQSSISLKGGAKLGGSLSSDLQLTITSLDPALLNNKVSGKIDGAGDLQINGNTVTTDINLFGLLQGLPFELDVDVASNNKIITINKAIVVSDNGQLEVTGTADLNGQASANLNLNGVNFNPQIFLPEYPGKLDFQGTLTLANNEFDTQLNINGKLRDYPLRAKVDASGSSENILIKPTSITSGDNTLKLSGSLRRNGIQQLEWDLNAPQLAVISSELNGFLKGKGRLNGEWNNMAGNSSLSGTKLSYKNFSINDLKLDFQPDENNYQALKLTASNIDLGRVSFDSLELDATGSIDQQYLTFALSKADGEKFSTQIETSKLESGYEIKLSNTNISGKSWPTLKQKSPAMLSIVNNVLDLENLCLTGETESLCVQASNDDTQLNSKISMQSLPLKRLTGWYGAANQLEEKLSGELSVSRQNSAWLLDLDLALDDGSTFDSNIQLNSVSKAIGGNINADFNNLQWLGILSEELVETKGKLDIDLSLDGTFEQPRLLGDIKVINASTNIPSIGISLNELNLAALANQTGVATIKGSANTGGGSVKLSGNIDYKPLQEWQLEFDIVGEQALVADLPEYRVIASPNVQLKVSPQKISVDGEITVNQANITLTEIPDKAISVSEDTRIINQKSEVALAKQSTPLRADLKIVLGDDVTLNGKGLEVKLGGTLDISENTNQATEANGTVYLTEGTYTAYGQNLSLNDGTLQFNGPINDPGINMRAERKIKTQTVGIRVGGTLNNLKSEVYSEPVLSESNSISYLITGKPIGAAGGSESSAVLKALTNFGVKGSASIIDDIRTSTGLSTLEIEGGDEIADTALLIGKYLSPQLYVQYVKRLFGENDSLQLRYEFNEKIQLEAETGTQQGIDLIYQLER